jgi:hypothetical protein
MLGPAQIFGTLLAVQFPEPWLLWKLKIIYKVISKIMKVGEVMYVICTAFEDCRM